MKNIILLSAAIASGLSLAGCESTTTNVNVNARNANTAVVTPATPVPAATVDRSNSNIPRDQYDKNRAEYEKERGTSTIGQGANDSWIWFKTRAALATAADLRDSTINVDVANDKITLKGTVATAAQKASAEKVAKSIEGQTGVKNELQVKPADTVTNQMVNGNSATKSNTNKKP